ncbi:MAG TPA: PH domain-containing protein, partial [Saprospiraceae bacterium]|nr:PH domain-containing protein [Saprospiraceae bacterium]
MEDHSLYAPQRQSPKAIALILIKYLRIIASTIWPILLVILINPATGKGLFVTVLVLGIAFLSLVYSLVAYSRFYYFIQDNAVCVRSGVFRRKVINIPFDRIQSVDFKSNLLHQLLHVVSVEVDTAGTKGRELKLDAIDLAQAHALRDVVLAFKRKTDDRTGIEISQDPDIPSLPASPELILSLSSIDLIKVGVSENHIRTAAIIFAFFLGLADDLDQ